MSWAVYLILGAALGFMVCLLLVEWLDLRTVTTDDLFDDEPSDCPYLYCLLCTFESEDAESCAD